jgi:hypothetical protein
MDRKIILSVLAAALMGFLGIWLLLSITPDQRAGVRLYPWDVSRDAAGQTRVLDLTLGQSTLADARALAGEEGKINLFDNPDGSRTVEVFFDDVILSNIRADWIITLDLDQDRLGAMYDRGLRVSKMSSGSHKVKMTPEDVEALATVPVRSLTYLPWKSLEARDIAGNFGPPAEQRTEQKSGVVHWLYPDKGMDIARDPDGGVVIQYLNPADYGRAVALLPAPAAAPGAAGRETPDPADTGAN